MRVVIRHWRQQGIRVLVWLDDLLFGADSFEHACEVRHSILLDLWKLGFHISPKSQLNPTPVTQFLGVVMDFTHRVPKWHVPDDKIADLLLLFQDLTSNHTPLTARRLAKLLGKLVSMSIAMIPTRIMSRELFNALAISHPANDWDKQVALSPDAIQELHWWLSNLIPWARQGRPIFPDLSVISVHITTDASPEGWGARVSDPSTNQHRDLAAPFDTVTATAPQCTRELSAVLFALRSLVPQLQHRHILIRTDNRQVVAHIMHLGGRSLQLSRIMKQIWDTCISHGIQLSAQHISGHQMIQEGVDALSRSVHEVDHSDWKLHPHLFHQLYLTVGPFTIDRFATPANVQSYLGQPLPFNSWVWFPGTDGVDAMLQDWTHDAQGHPHRNYGNPPFAMVDKVLRLIFSQRVNATIILPHWPSQPWWPLLRFASALHWLPWQASTFLPASTSHAHPIQRASFRALAATFRRSDLLSGVVPQSFPLRPLGGITFPPRLPGTTYFPPAVSC